MKCFLTIAVLAGGVPLMADEFIGPCAVFTETGRINRDVLRYVDSVATEFGISDGKYSSYNRARMARESSYIRQFQSVKSFAPVFGTAWYVQVKDGAPSLFRCGFVTVPDKAGARSMADTEVERREALGFVGTEVVKHGSGWVVRTTGVGDVDVGQPAKTMVDLRIAYKDDVVVSAWQRPEVHALPLASLAKKARVARGKAWYWNVDPTIVPPALRRQFANTIRKETAAALQRRDSEDADAYDLRRLLGENYLDMLTAGLMEVEEASAWVALPTQKHGFRAVAEVRFAEDGRLSGFADVLRRGRTTLTAGDDAILSAAVRCGSPESLRDLFVTGIAAQPNLVNSSVGRMLLLSAEQRSLEAIFTLRQARSDTPGLAVGVRVAGDALAPSELKPLLGDGSVGNGSHLSMKSKTPASHVLGLGMTDGLLTWSVASEAGLHEIIANGIERRPARTRPALLEVRGDLSRLAGVDLESATGQLLQRAEKACDKWFVDRAARGLVNVVEMADSSYASLADRITKEGDWTLDGSVELTKTSVRSELKIGRELARFLTARYIAAQNRLQDSIVPGQFRSTWDLQMGR